MRSLEAWWVSVFGHPPTQDQAELFRLCADAYDLHKRTSVTLVTALERAVTLNPHVIGLRDAIEATRLAAAHGGV